MLCRVAKQKKKHLYHYDCNHQVIVKIWNNLTGLLLKIVSGIVIISLS